MPTINESELDGSDAHGDCAVCYENAGDIWLCGEGYLCTQCYAKYGDLEEAEAFDEVNVNPDVKNKIKGKLAGEKIDAKS